MKNKRLKTYRKLGILLFGVSLLVYDCQKDIEHDEDLESQDGSLFSKIDFNTFKNNIKNENIKNLDANKLVNNQASSFGHLRFKSQSENFIISIDSTDVLMAEKDGVTSYTFKTQTTDMSKTTNYILAHDENNNTAEYYLSYEDDGSSKVIDPVNGSDFTSKSRSIWCPISREIWVCVCADHEPGNCVGICTRGFHQITIVTNEPCPSGGEEGSGGGPGDGGTGGNGNGNGDGEGTGGGSGDGGSGGNDLPIDGPIVTKPRKLEKDDCDTSKEDLKKVFPNMSNTDASTLAKVINDYGKDFGIDSDEDLWHFLSQAGHETGGFNTLSVTESTYWTTASKLAKTYKKFTMDSTLAATDSTKYYAPDYLQNSSGVANVAMCCEYGNGNVASGDGYKYRGRGLFQLTWKDNYTAFKTWYNNKYDPDIDPVATPNIIASNDTLAILSGLWYYKTRVVDKITIDSTTTVSKVTKPINPAKKGLADRKQRFQKAKDSIKCK